MRVIRRGQILSAENVVSIWTRWVLLVRNASQNNFKFLLTGETPHTIMFVVGHGTRG